jgi:hypothetical protein
MTARALAYASLAVCVSCGGSSSEGDGSQSIDSDVDASHVEDGHPDGSAMDASFDDATDDGDIAAEVDGNGLICSTTNCAGTHLCCEGFKCIDSLCCAPRGWPCDFADAAIVCCNGGCNATRKCF